ncbi:MAG TPA: hypothetical protein VLJ59_18770 [Mycobacteriales bacterium]|nr:hypothetical protein [Mycobacteriales bacterium]
MTPHFLQHCSNTPDLLADLEAVLWMVQRDDLADDPKLSGSDRVWRLRDRLREQDMDAVVRVY